MTKKSHHRKTKRVLPKNLEVYAFWTGFASTLISLAHVLLIAITKS